MGHRKGATGTITGGRRGRKGSPTSASASKAVVKPQAAYHQATRRAHAAEQAEDYVEAIAELIESQGRARVVDLARCLGVSHVTVIRTVARLQRASLVVSKPYRALQLTELGTRLAQRVKRRHQIVVSFLRSIGVSEEVAHADAEGIEHHVSAETLTAFEQYVTKQKGSGRND